MTKSIPNSQTVCVDGWQGYIDTADSNIVRGWIKKLNSDLPESIDVHVGNIKVSSSYLADISRGDLLAAGSPSTSHGFEVSIAEIYPLEDDIFTVYIRSAETKELILSKEFANFELKADYRGTIDKVSNIISGWFVDAKTPDRIFSAEILVDSVLYAEVNNNGSRPDLELKAITGGRGGFNIPFTPQLLGPGSHVVSLRFPNGMVVNHASAITNETTEVVFVDESVTDRAVSIVVPIFNAYDDLVVCMDCILRNTLEFARIILIDDASTDSRVQDYLNQFKRSEKVTVLTNRTNQGFTKTVNLGLEESGQDDIVILNSDARVTYKWLQGLLVAAKSAPKIATVTPLSDNAGAFSAPRAGSPNLLPFDVSEDQFARAFRRRSSGSYPRVPTGNGFCMFISRDCVNAIGSFDANAFPRGYGEENDFCMRAFRAGWSNIIDDRTYVFHARSKSFGETKHELMASGRTVLDNRYPEYAHAIKVFSTSAEISMARYIARLTAQDCQDEAEQLPRVLFVISTTTGGTPQTNMDLMGALDDAIEPWLLRCDSFHIELSVFKQGNLTRVRRHKLREPVNPITHLSQEYDRTVGGWLFHYDITIIHVRHIAWHSLSILKVADKLGIPSVVSFHDYYAISPTIKLIDDEGIFLGSSYRREGSDFRESLWPIDSMPAPTGVWLTQWRARFARILDFATCCITTSESARNYITEAIPSLAKKFHVIPHGRDFHKFHSLRQAVTYNQPIRILVPGNINCAKGLNIIRELVKIDRARCLEFHILGKLDADLSSLGPRIVVHGAYQRAEFAVKVAAIRPHFGAVFSIWDETYCHTLTELWSVGLPVFVLDFPTVASRVKQSGCGWVLKHDSISDLYMEIVNIALSPIEEAQSAAALLRWQRGDGLANSVRSMAVQYLEIYRNSIGRKHLSTRKAFSISTQVRPRVSVVCPADESLRHAPGSTHIRVWERTRNSVDRPVSFIRMNSEALLASVEAGTIDGAIIQRNVIPSLLAEKLLDRLASKKISFLYDLDDDLLNVPSSHDPDGFYSSYASTLRLMLQSAATVSVSTETLLRRISSLTDRGVIVPNALSDRLWRRGVPPRESDPFVSAVYMGTKSHAVDLKSILPALDEVADKFPQFRLYLVGILLESSEIKGRDRWMEVVEPPVGCSNYCNFVPWLKQQTKRFDFGIAPLVGTEFDDAKSDLKLLDYSGLELPTVCSDVTAYRQSNVNAIFVPNSMEDWVQALSGRVANGPGNRQLGKLLRDFVTKNRMINSTLDDYDRLLLRIFG